MGTSATTTSGPGSDRNGHTGPVNVLFVDDDRAMLASIRRGLRPWRTQLDARFASSAAEAVAAMEDNPAQVVVTDMRMPGTSGAELLVEVATRWPSTVRMVLSGQASWASVNVVVRAHRFLTKPCPLEELVDAVLSADPARMLPVTPVLARIAEVAGRVPVLPQTHWELSGLLSGPTEPDLGQVDRLVSRDVGLASRLLQLANSAFFGLPRRVTTVRDATMIVGLSRLRSLIAAAEIWEDAPRRVGRWSPTSHLERASVMVAVTGALTRDHDALLAAVLCEVGQLVLQRAVPDLYRDVPDDDTPLCTHEQGRLGVDHAQVGAWVCQLWGMPETVSRAVLHHCGEQIPDGTPDREVRAAVELIRGLQRGPCGPVLEGGWDPHWAAAAAPVLDRLGVPGEGAR